MKNISYLLAIHSVEGLGPVRIKKLVAHFKDPKNIWDAEDKDLADLNIPHQVLVNLNYARKNLNPEKYYQDILDQKIQVVSFFDEGYPKLLKQIFDPPIILYFLGSLNALEKKSVAIVGSRKMTQYGKLVTEDFTLGLAKANITIVSGLALGVDAIAHKTTLKAKGETIAVLGGGLNKIFPPVNTSLAKEIINNSGALITEFPPDYPSLAGNFPARNRIIAGLTQATLVTEAAENSGSLITANLAAEYGKEVFAVPGSINSPLSQGPNNLIKNGATLVTNFKDILDFLGIDQDKKTVPVENLSLNLTEKKIVDFLNETSSLNPEIGTHIDQICRELNLATSIVSASLIKMEIAGVVKNLGGGNYIKSY